MKTLHPRADVTAVLFDLDGTLVDSAPDLAGAANELRDAHGLPPLAYDQLRPVVGSGARGMLRAAFGIDPGDARFEALREDFLSRYEARILSETRVFERIEPVLQALERSCLRWGIVTNKASRFSVPVVQGLGLAERCAVLVSGDTTPHAKPHPAPLLEAARRIGLPAGQCIYVGDDRRDIEAGRGAGMRVLAAAWGYLGQDESVHAWQADAVLEHPESLLNWLGLA
ncbi:MAG: phosphoglycolate phosphatase [Burkholderiales bacterium]|jgi:phosphoglycolate phosphatase|nr:phosphoglycolate phosphatase [Xanthomonadales bacterium]MBN8495025.1 phosphoglycolate phosphatase [Burkholderiales bacterium]